MILLFLSFLLPVFASQCDNETKTFANSFSINCNYCGSDFILRQPKLLVKIESSERYSFSYVPQLIQIDCPDPLNFCHGLICEDELEICHRSSPQNNLFTTYGYINVYAFTGGVTTEVKPYDGDDLKPSERIKVNFDVTMIIPVLSLIPFYLYVFIKYFIFEKIKYYKKMITTTSIISAPFGYLNYINFINHINERFYCDCPVENTSLFNKEGHECTLQKDIELLWQFILHFNTMLICGNVTRKLFNREPKLHLFFLFELLQVLLICPFELFISSNVLSIYLEYAAIIVIISSIIKIMNSILDMIYKYKTVKDI
jgi:hypothetical protein